MQGFEKFYDVRLLKTSADIQRKVMDLVKENLKEGVDEDLVGAIGTLINAAVARATHETLDSVIVKAQHLQKRQEHLH